MSDWRSLIPAAAHREAANLPCIEPNGSAAGSQTGERTLVPHDVAPDAAEEIWKRPGCRPGPGLIPRSLFASDQEAEEAARASEATEAACEPKRFGTRTLISFGAQEGEAKEQSPSLSMGQPCEDTILQAMLDQPTTHFRSNHALMPISLVTHGAVLAMFVLVPLFFTDAVDIRELSGKYGLISMVPKPPAPAPPPPPPMVVRPPQVKVVQTQARMVMPTVIPKEVVITPEEHPPEIQPSGDPGGVIGGIPGGQAGGVMGGILAGVSSNSTATAPAAPPPPEKRVYRVGGNIQRPRQITSTRPDYPTLARTAKIQGVVVIEAVIDEKGNVVELHAVSGHPLLIPSALRCVSQWKYEPIVLNGSPISVSLSVEVTFSLSK